MGVVMGGWMRGLVTTQEVSDSMLEAFGTTMSVEDLDREKPGILNWALKGLK